MPDLAAGEGGLITVTGVVKVPRAAGTLTNTASITTTSTDGDPDNNANSADVTVPNVAPVANDATHSTYEESVLIGNLSASDPNGDTVSYTLATAAVSGTVLVNAITGKFAYTSANSLSSYIDHFSYVVTDTGALTATAAVTIQVTAYDDPPSVSNIPNQPTAISAPAGPISFTVSDPDTPAEVLTLDSASSYTELVPTAPSPSRPRRGCRARPSSPSPSATATRPLSIALCCLSTSTAHPNSPARR